MKNEKTEVKIENKKEYKTPKLTLKYRVFRYEENRSRCFYKKRKTW